MDVGRSVAPENYEPLVTSRENCQSDSSLGLWGSTSTIRERM
jgi:hypothetical protein